MYDGQARADVLQDRLDALNFNQKKKRLRPTLSIDDPSLTQPQATQSIVASQFATPSVFEDFGTQAGAGTVFKSALHPLDITSFFHFFSLQHRCTTIAYEWMILFLFLWYPRMTVPL
jgi:hypothetical protein